uniref:alpha-amylase family glycosyl hydrolase n=1 Tax=Ningiella ruwaisensis TaxID=2364274 RepID=UPI001F501589|nr:alpha-amylase family glycosyl hydrolase [Ningiella ruwaisensis]
MKVTETIKATNTVNVNIQKPAVTPANLFKPKCILAALAVTMLAACGQAPESQNETSTSPVESQHTAKTNPDKTVPVSEQLDNYLTRDIKDEVFYFVMPDRFHNGKPENDMGDPDIPISYGGLDKTSKWAFHGGDMVGLEAKLDYLQNLGITSIWMTPILRNKAIQKDGFGHHGYWVVDFTEIDPHFGSNEELKSLIDAAHERNIKVFFDIITNHTADVIKFRECHNDDGSFKEEGQTKCAFITEAEMAAGKTYTPFVPENEQGVKVPDWLNDPKYYNNQGDNLWQGESVITGDFAGLDDIDTSMPEVQQNMISIFKDLISEFKPDGFRIDTVKHVDIEFWQVFAPAITEHAQDIGIPNFHLFGEVYDGNPAGLSKYTTEGQLPSVLDFGFFFNVKDALLEGKDINRIAHLFDNDDYYRDADSGPDLLLNFLGNHDAGRVGHFLQASLADASPEEHLQRSKLAHALMFFSRGVPVVYYGDEQGFTGDGGDVDARENMDPSLVDVYNDNILIGTDKTTADDNFDPNHPLYLTINDLAQTRIEHLPLRRGIHQMKLVDNNKGLLAFSRIDIDTRDEYLVLMNSSNETQTLELPVDANQYEIIYALKQPAEIKVNEGFLSTKLAPLSLVVLDAKSAVGHAALTEISIGDMYEENDRVFIPAEVSFENNLATNLINVEFYAVDSMGNEVLLASDNTHPYRAVVMPSVLDATATIKVRASNYADQTIETSLEID